MAGLLDAEGRRGDNGRGSDRDGGRSQERGQLGPEGVGGRLRRTWRNRPPEPHHLDRAPRACSHSASISRASTRAPAGRSDRAARLGQNRGVFSPAEPEIGVQDPSQER